MGHPGMSRTFIDQCYFEWKCNVLQYANLSYSLDDLERINLQQRDSIGDPQNIESSIFRFFHSIEHSFQKLKGHLSDEPPPNWRNGLSSFMRKRELSIPVFFTNKESQENEYVEANNDPMETESGSSRILPLLKDIAQDEMKNGSSMPSQDRQSTQTLVQCIIIPGLTPEAVCRECLIMHSKWLAIRTYQLMHMSKYSGELFVFPTDQEQEDILRNCLKTFCQSLLPLDSRECNKIIEILPNSQQLKIIANGKSIVTGQKNNPWSKHEIEQNIEHIGLKRMTRLRYIRRFEKFASKTLKTLAKLLSGRSSCIKIVADLRGLRKCVSCVLRRTGGDGVLIYSSQLEAILLTPTSKEFLDCKGCEGCKGLSILHSAGYQEYIADHITAMQIHQQPSHLHLIADSIVGCVVAYHSRRFAMRCQHCMLEKVDGKVVHHMITPHWLLLHTSGINWKVNIFSFRNLLTCHSYYLCARIQMVPKAFCSEHLAFVSTAHNHSIDQKKIHRFTAESIPVGVWPPQAHRIVSHMDTMSSSPSCFSHAESEVGTQIWPVHDNIAFVRFEYAKDQQIDCIKCLIEHSEGFLLYANEHNPDGYLWMRQAPANILKKCVGNLCSSLAYDEQRIQIQRPAGLLQLTRDDNPFIWMKVTKSFERLAAFD